MADVKLLRVGNTLLIHPWVPALDPVLQYKRREQTDTWPKRFVNKVIKLYCVDKGNGITYGGLYTRVCNALRERRIPFVVENHLPPLPEADFSRISKDLRQGQDTVLAAISVSYNGVIDCPTAFGKSFVIKELVKMYPNLKILVATPGKQVVESLFSRISTETDSKVIQVRSGHKFYPEADVVVCTAASLHNIPPDWPDLFLFDECHGAPAPQTQERLVTFSGCRMFGFSASPEGRGDNADLMIEAFFGHRLVTISYKDAMNADSIVPIEVYVKRVSGPDVQARTDVEKQRKGYWNNKFRNAAIAAVAKNVPPDMQTLIMVKTTEHALRLRHLLPEYAVVHSGKDREGWASYMLEGVLGDSWYTEEEIAPYAHLDYPIPSMLDDFVVGKMNLACYEREGSVDTTDLRERFEKGSLKKAISTTIWKEGIDPIHLRVLIRADGSSGNIPATQIPGRLARKAEGKSMGILIDFLDCYGTNYHKRSLTRLRHYRKKEWRIHDEWDGRFTAEMGSI